MESTKSRAPTILATDLDGTLLGGADADRLELLHSLVGREDIRVVFVTGRGLERVLPLLSDPRVPKPSYIICDVGASVFHGDDLRPVQPLQASISSRWPGTARVQESFESVPYLIRQDVPQEHRCSFTMFGRERVGPEVHQLVDKLDCNLVESLNHYVDVLPKGIDKGSTLLALAEHMEVAISDIVVAGDTLNDLSMFQIGARGIVVGEAEPALVDAVSGLPGTYRARRPGAGGISEGLSKFGLMQPKPLPVADEAQVEGKSPEEQPVVMVYHRLPFDEVESSESPHERVRRPVKSPNGIIPSLLGFFSGGRRGQWFAWSLQKDREPAGFEAVVEVDRERYPNLLADRIALTEEDVEIFYKRFSKEAFWPIIFSFPERAVFNHTHWERFVEINRIFAERVAQRAEANALVWFHDYNLWMVPAFLRPRRPDLRLAFFHHTAFPPADVFNILPWRREIVGSLLQCDYVGFHVPRYVQNFVDVAQSCAPVRVKVRSQCAPRFATFGCALGVEEMSEVIDVAGRRVGLGAHPVGIDVGRIESILAQQSTRDAIASISNELEGRQVVLSVERLDYVKGQLEKVSAFERMLENHPELHGKVVLVNVVTPAAAGMKIYGNTRAQVDQAVGRVNGRFGRMNWTPIRYFFQSLPFESVLAYYAVADIAWITPLRDGLNLVAKEYVAARGIENRPGLLVLSEFAGAAAELHGAMLTNPYDERQLSEDLHRALTTSVLEREERMRRLYDIVRSNDVHDWGSAFMAAATASTER